jgi:hypothetical protein
LKVVHAGDIFPGKQIPLLDANNGGSGRDLPRTLSLAHDLLGDVDTIITGHSTVMRPADLEEWAQFNQDFLDAVAAAKRAGRTVDDVAGSWTIPAKYQGYAAPQAARLRANIELIYKELP